LQELMQLDPLAQAELFGAQSSPLVSFITEHVRAAAASVTSLVARIREVRIDSKEDDTTGFIRELLGSRLEFINWTVSDQSTSGLTENGNPGERDLTVYKGRVELAVLEAVVCKRNPTTKFMQADLKSHFQKLFSYSPCRLSFLIAYAYTRPLSAIVEQLELIAEHDAADHCTFIEKKPIIASDSRPGGFQARYRADGGEIVVVFLVLDMKQGDLLQAAAKAQRNSARKRTTTKAQRTSPVAAKQPARKG
jgi:hypothetical protein